MKRFLSFAIVIAITMFYLTPYANVNAEGETSPASAVIKTNETLKKESTVYAGEIFVDGQSQMKWLYSNDLTKSMAVYDNLREALPNSFANLVPSSVSGEGSGIAVSSSHQDEMNSNWTSASYVANQYYTGTIGTETNNNLYDVNNDYKNWIDTKETERQSEITSPIESNKRVVSIISTSVNSDWQTIGGVLKRVDTITFDTEATTVNYTRVDVTTNSNIIRKTTTIYHTIVDGKLTVTGDDSFSKNYKSGNADNEDDYIDGNYTDDAVINKINEYSDDMNSIASKYHTTATINGKISSYYYNAHDEITQDQENGKIVINTILNKYQVYTLTGKAESKKIKYTLNDEIGNQISFKDYEGIVFVFNSTDILNITDEELQAIADEMEVDVEEIKAMGNQVIEKAKNALKGKGSLVGLYDFSVSDGNSLIKQASGGFKIKIKMTDEMKKYNDFSIAFLKDDGNLDELIKLTQNGEYLEGVLPHLSTYVVIGNNVEKTSNTATNPQTGDNIPLYISMLLLSIISLFGSGLYIRKKAN